MNRRAFVAGLGAVLAAPLGGEAQQTKTVPARNGRLVSERLGTLRRLAQIRLDAVADLELLQRFL
jgi:hypothetical protein